MQDQPTPLLLTPYALRGVNLRNRNFVSPMSQYGSEPGGIVGDWHLVHLGKFALGGAGMVFCEETSVSERSRKTYDCPGIYTDAQAKAWQRVTGFLRANGAVPAMQIGHAGRKVATRAPWDGFAPLGPEDAAKGRPPWSGLAPSPIPFKAGALLPKEMDADDIRDVIGLHVEATKRTLDAGFDVLEVHAAHGYIIQQFLSPATNQRRDGYGGDREGRMRACAAMTSFASLVAGAAAADLAAGQRAGFGEIASIRRPAGKQCGRCSGGHPRAVAESRVATRWDEGGCLASGAPVPFRDERSYPRRGATCCALSHIPSEQGHPRVRFPTEAESPPCQAATQAEPSSNA